MSSFCRLMCSAFQIFCRFNSPSRSTILWLLQSILCPVSCTGIDIGDGSAQPVTECWWCSFMRLPRALEVSLMSSVSQSLHLMYLLHLAAVYGPVLKLITIFRGSKPINTNCELWWVFVKLFLVLEEKLWLQDSPKNESSFYRRFFFYFRWNI